MKNFNLLFRVLVIGICVFSSAPVRADGSAVGIDYTSQITNPKFDLNTLEGWTIDSKYAANFNVVEVYNTAFNLYQEVTGLPEGFYEVRVEGFYRVGGNDGGAAYAAGTEVITSMLYASIGEDTLKTPLPSLYSQTGITVSGGGALTNGYVNNLEGASQGLATGRYSAKVTGVEVKNGTLVIGIKNAGALLGKNWTVFDNFQLTLITGPWNLIEQIDKKFNDYSAAGQIPSGILNEIEELRVLKEGFSGNEDESELEELLTAFRTLETRVGAAASVMDSLFTELDLAITLEKANYPGVENFTASINKAVSLTESDATTEEGNLVYPADLHKAIIELQSAILVYRFSQAVPANGLDCSWAMKTPDFTKNGGNAALLTDASSEGWTINNVAVSGDFRLNMVNGRNCWNNYSENFTSMNVYQELKNLPAGFYKFECFQTNSGPEMTDQHAYIMAVGGKAVSPNATYTFAADMNPDKGTFTNNSVWEGPLETGKVLVGSDGKLRVGFASTSNANSSSGWFCFTGCKLTYYGMPSGGNEEALQRQIDVAKTLKLSKILPADKNTLNEGIKEAEKVRDSGNAVTQADLETLNSVIVAAEGAIREFEVFKDGAYANIAAIEENENGIYSQSIQDFSSDLLISIDDLCRVDTTSHAVLHGLTGILDQTLSVMIPLLEKAEGLNSDPGYDPAALAKLNEAVAGQLNKFTSDLIQFAQVKRAIEDAMMRAVLPETIGVDGVDVTIWLTNPGFEESVWSTGWTNDGFGLTTAMPVRDDWYTNNAVETWTGRGGKLTNKTISQTMLLPNGEYKLSVIATACQQGKIFIYEEDGLTKKDSITLKTPVTGVWLFANNDSIELATPMIGQEAPYENQTVDNEPHSQLFELAGIKVTDETLTFGIKIRSTIANWVAMDNFGLTCFSYSAVGVEETQEDKDLPVVYQENGLIRVVGTDEFTVTTIDGVSVPSDKQLEAGVYLVNIGTQTIKIMIK